ncbi:MAG: amidohydrolase family protein [Gemmatimonadetes bacterium]|nr:amidohydrolase family protein [Gemmatimonadota bacterium]MCH8937205.1 amidohydrolase family protein [Gemmatimonadota bacterium]
MRSALSLPEAIRKMTVLPASRLEQSVPSMIRKGRLNPGADADLVVFDPDRVNDRATYQNPTQASDGIDFVLVAGEVVVRDGRLQEGVKAGRAVRRGRH